MYFSGSTQIKMYNEMVKKPNKSVLLPRKESCIFTDSDQCEQPSWQGEVKELAYSSKIVLKVIRLGGQHSAIVVIDVVEKMKTEKFL